MKTPGRFWTLAVALVAISGLIAASAWMLSSSDLWPTPTREAELALNAGNLPRAGILLSRVIQDDPRQAHARLLYARFLRLSGMPRDADVALAKAMDLGVPEASLWREYGLLLADSDFHKAEPILIKALQAHPGDRELLRVLTDGLSRQGNWPKAAEFYEQWLKLEPDRTEALMGRSRALVQSGQALEAASELLSILARNPDDYDARMLLANCYLSNADMKEAEPELERCRRLRPDRPEPLAGLAGCAVERDELVRAHELLDQAVNLDPSSILALSSRGNLALNLRQYDLALADFRRVVALDPDNKQGHLSLAQLFRRSGDREKAEEHEQAYRRLQGDQEAKFRAIRGMR